MSSSDWLIFEWDLVTFAASTRLKIPPFVFRHADADDRETVEKVIRSAFSAEPPLSSRDSALIMSPEAACDTAFSGPQIACVVVQHGTRIIGASAMDSSEDTANHLLTGPCILQEYRNRGIGSALLFSSLEFLQDRGLEVARGRSRAQSTAGRFVYRKFDGRGTPIAIEPKPESVTA